MFAFSGIRKRTKENYEWEMSFRQPGETYLGGGIYVSFDGRMIKLRSPLMEDGCIEKLYLERADAEALKQFIIQCFGVENER